MLSTCCVLHPMQIIYRYADHSQVRHGLCPQVAHSLLEKPLKGIPYRMLIIPFLPLWVLMMKVILLPRDLAFLLVWFIQ